MQKDDISQVKKKSVSGVIALTTRTFFLQIISFGATFLLTIFLSPATFGVYYVVLAIISFLRYFSDIGLAAALIQKKKDFTEEDLATTFTIQQFLVITLVIFALFFSKTVSNFYNLNTHGLWLFRALVISFFISSLKTIPSVLLERKLDFKKLIIPEIVENIGFYSLAVYLAWRGYGISSFTYAVLVRGVLGLITIYIISPWRISVGLNISSAKILLKFGVPFQLNSLLALVKDDLLTVFLGKVLPFSYIGYIGWAKKWSEVPLRLIMDSIVRVTFPAFSRIQHDFKLIKKAIETTLFGISTTVFPITIAMIFFIKPLVDLIPKYSKWEPALFSFSLFAFSSAASSMSVPLTNTLNAIGKIKITLKLMIMWTLLTWILTIVLINLYSFNGVAIASLIITVTIILVIKIVKKITRFSFFSSVTAAIIGIIIQSIFYYFAIRIVPIENILSLITLSLIGFIIYAAFVWLTQKSKIRAIVESIK